MPAGSALHMFMLSLMTAFTETDQVVDSIRATPPPGNLMVSVQEPTFIPVTWDPTTALTAPVSSPFTLVLVKFPIRTVTLDGWLYRRVRPIKRATTKNSRWHTNPCIKPIYSKLAGLHYFSDDDSAGPRKTQFSPEANMQIILSL